MPPFSCFVKALHTPELISLLARQTAFAYDSETTALDATQADLVGFSFAIKAGEAWYVPIPAGKDVAQAIVEEFRPVFENEAIEKIGQNLKYDSHILRRHGMPVSGWAQDTMVAAFLLEPDRPTFNMDSLAAFYLGHETIKYASLVGSGARQQTLDHQTSSACATRSACARSGAADWLSQLLLHRSPQVIWHSINPLQQHQIKTRLQ